MSFRANGGDILKRWLEEQRWNPPAPSVMHGHKDPAIFCPACGEELNAFHGRNSKQYIISHRITGCSWKVCPLERTLSVNGADRQEALPKFMEFCYAYRSKKSTEVVSGEDPGPAQAALPDCIDIEPRAEPEGDQGGAGSTDDVNRLLEDARDSTYEPGIWEKI